MTVTRRAPLAILVALAMVASATWSPLPTATASAAGAVPTITTVAGTTGEGHAMEVGQYPFSVTLRGGELYIADAANHVVRAIDLSSGVERVVAGNGAAGLVTADVDDGVPARASALYGPQDVAFDAAGNMYIADALANRIRKVSPAGTITTVAGRGDQTAAGDGGPATLAGLYQPGAVASDAAGNLYIADTYNNRIRHVTAAGTITTIAGTAAIGGDGDGGPATAAELHHPTGLLLEPGGLLIADAGNHRIRRVDFATGVISTFAGTGTAGWSGDGGPAVEAELNAPGGLASHPEGGYVIADTLNHRLRRVTTGGVISTIAGNGVREYGDDGIAATETNLFAPEGVAVAPDGTIFLADTRASRVRAIDPSSGLIFAVAGTYYPHWNGDGPAARTQVSQVRGVALAPNGDVYFSDSFTHLIRRIRSSDGHVVRVTGDGNPGSRGDGDHAQYAQVFSPMGLTFAPDGDLLFADDAANKVRRIDSVTGTITTVAGTGTAGFAGDGGAATSAALSAPRDVAVAPDGDLLIADGGNHRLRRVDAATGVISTIAGTGERESTAGDGGPATSAPLSYPGSVAVRPDGTIFVSQTGFGRVRRIDAAGTITTYAGGGPHGVTGFTGDGGPATSASLNSPHGIALDAAGALYIADGFSFRVRRVTPDGRIDSVAGNGRSGFVGDGGPPTDARLNFPLDVAVTSAGDAVYVADFLNQRVRRAGVVPPAAPPPVSETTVPPPAPTTSAPPPKPAPAPAPASRSGYWMVGRNGDVHAFGDAPWFGGASMADVVDLEPTPSGDGYWVVNAAGHVHTFGGAAYAGGSPALEVGETVTSMSAARSGGYWLFTTRGRVFGYGGAPHLGDMWATRLNGPVLDSIPTPSGRGYYMVASDGGIFTFGDARFEGSMGSTPLNAPVQSLVPDADGTGYWLVASDGGIFAFDAAFYGSMGDTRLNRPVTGMVGGANGYLMVAEDGGIFTFGDAAFHGSLGASPPVHPITAVATIPRG